ncbi:potassium-transporting ATPase subunit KdpA [Rhodobacter capsulatus]|uniref:potassium-transporting ATPase subunit KdpA n=1 Tax=Rhodobacter capsulatus TaxID=1061 RepID=UPI0006DC23C8|nr:potassium-transporting ATPase subunit KdpA [Rhodobacter capsulatus]KQB12179.1 ATPase [Rhodobacter capsulatus]KQB12679.1 ATPase [Rhodobacter capsulatus]PZX23234.1 K+-transporting ATPase ATPase A chain [Rhodobacter capsulatus]QNR61750.1 potassium-transporting ATPase subunit KdpA [Rhodobacter capsulatus]
MTVIGWLQIAAVLLCTLATAVPLGRYMARLFSGERTFLHPLLHPVERGFYRLAGVAPDRDQGWLNYAFAMLAFSAAGFAALYLILRAQGLMPFNPGQLPGLPADLAFNTAVSFLTNTNWQAYAGETTMSPFSQMAGLAVQNFLSAATGIALAMAVTRAFARAGTDQLGNFWVDMTRATLYVLLPLAILVALALVVLGVPQTLTGSVGAVTLEGAQQTIALGPVASQEAIKQLGTNGGGFFNANSAHPLENPSGLSNGLVIWAMLAISAALPITFGRMTGSERQGWAILSAMGLLLVAATATVYWAETSGTPHLTALGLDPLAGNMEGKELRFGQAMSALFVAVTTGLSCGAVNTMHDSLTPLGGLVPMLLMQLGEVLPGGVGSGLYGMVVFCVLSVFVAGLMVGRSPEFLGKKIEAREIRLAVLAVLILPLVILGFTSASALLPSALASLNNAGPHGLSELLYAYSSAAGNNGSAFAGLNANTPWFNTTLGIAMMLGRFAYVLPVLAMAGALASKPRIAASPGTFPTTSALFVGLLVGVIVILGGLQFFPALALGPIVEQVLMRDLVTF